MGPAEELSRMTTEANGVKVGRSVDQTNASPLQSALNNHAEQLDKLAGFVAQLTERLAPVRNSSPENTESERGEALPSASSVTSQLTGQTVSVQVLQRRLQELLQELEV